ncbi:MAG: hypothetical protein KBF57_00885 [Saprospiraceae bacterium]|nr:hypothetical protein [Saprospiraceae bacterium]
MENSKQGKLKSWSESFKPQPNAEIWQRIEARLNNEPAKNKSSLLTLTTVRLAAVFVFVLVSVGAINTFFTNGSDTYSMSKSIELTPLNLTDVSIYLEPQKVKELKSAYAKLNNNK